VSVLGLSRWHFSVINNYHFLFRSISGGMVSLFTGFATARAMTGHGPWPQVAKFGRKPFPIGSVIGDVTGIAGKSEFGMNWSVAARMVSPELSGVPQAGGVGAIAAPAGESAAGVLRPPAR